MSLRLENIRNHLSLELIFGNSYLKNKPTYSDYIKKQLERRKKINVANNIYFNPIHLDFLIENIFNLLKNNYYGIFNIGSKDCISKYSFAKKIAKKYKLNEDYIVKYQSKFHIHNRPWVPIYLLLNLKRLKKIALYK